MSLEDGFLLAIDPPLAGPADGPLNGLRVAVKDNFDLADTVTGAGSPTWAATQARAARNARLVGRLLELGAVVNGKTHMDELAFSLMGQNAHYGTPHNPVTPDRVPGGSSSGSAVAVASGAADIGLGSDTGGSVRVPAAFCGLFGWRPTHGALPTEGMLGLASSYDVPGFLTRESGTLERLAALLLPGEVPAPGALRTPRDLWEMATPETAATLRQTAPPADEAPLLPPSLRDALLDTFRICQGADVAALLGPWIAANTPEFGPGVAERFAAACAITPDAAAAARATRASIRTHLLSHLSDRTVLIYPTTPGPAPLLTCSGAEMDAYRATALTLLSVAGHAGLPQVTLPLIGKDGAARGLSLVGAPGSDRLLLAIATRLAGEAEGVA